MSKNNVTASKNTTPGVDDSKGSSEPTMENLMKNMFAQLQSLNERLDKEKEEARRRSLDSDQKLAEVLQTVNDVQQENAERLDEIRALSFMDNHERQSFQGPPPRRSSLEPREPGATTDPPHRRSTLESRPSLVTVNVGDHGLPAGMEGPDSERGPTGRETPLASAVHIMHVAKTVDPSLQIRYGTVKGRMMLEQNWRTWCTNEQQILRKVFFVHETVLQGMVTFHQSSSKSAATLLTMKNVHTISDDALDKLWSAMIRGYQMTTNEGYNAVWWKMCPALEASDSKWRLDSGEDYDLKMQGPFGRWITDIYDAWSFLSKTAGLEEMKNWPPSGWCDHEDKKIIGQVQMAMMAMGKWEEPFTAYTGQSDVKKLKDMSEWKVKMLEVNIQLGKEAQELRGRRSRFKGPANRKALLQGFNDSGTAHQEASDNRSPPFSRHDLDGGQDSSPKPRTPLVDHSRSEQVDHDRFSLSPEETTPQRLDPGARRTAPQPSPLLQEGSSRDIDSAKHGAMQSLSPYDEDGHHGSGTRDSRKSSQPCIYHFTGRCNRNCGRTHDADAMLQYRDDLVEQVMPHFEQLINSPWVKPQWVIDQFSACMRKSSNEEARRIAAMQRLKAPLYPALESSQYHS